MSTIKGKRNVTNPDIPLHCSISFNLIFHFPFQVLIIYSNCLVLGSGISSTNALEIPAFTKPSHCGINPIFLFQAHFHRMLVVYCKPEYISNTLEILYLAKSHRFVVYTSQSHPVSLPFVYVDPCSVGHMVIPLCFVLADWRRWNRDNRVLRLIRE